MIRIKNNDTIQRTWSGQEIQPGEYYILSQAEIPLWASNDTLILDISSGVAVVSNGDIDILSISDAIRYLQGQAPIEATITSQPSIIVESQPPFAQPTYRTKRSAIANLVTIPAGQSATIDYFLSAERYVAGGVLIATGVVLGDYATAEIYDPNGVVPVQYRAALCEAWPSVATYIEKEWINVQEGTTVHKIDTYPLNAKITAGLSLRLTYYATAAGGDRVIGINYYLTKKL